MNVTSILNKIIPFVCPDMHKTRQNALTACVLSLAQGSPCTVTSIGRGIRTKAYEKHRIKRTKGDQGRSKVSFRVGLGEVLRPKEICKSNYFDYNEHNDLILER